jgi:transcriptional regulator with XRE-family HTH domain
MDARGHILRKRRLELGLKMEQAAEQCGVDVGTISRMEAGKLPKASFDTWIKVCDALGLDLNDLAKPRVPELV